MTPLITALITWGPALIRTVGTLFGGKTEEASKSIANLVDSVRGMPADMAEVELARRMGTVPPEMLIAFETARIKLAEIERDREANTLNAQTAQTQAIQLTAQIEAQSTDDYVRRTRPGIARKSLWATLAYASVTGVLFPGLNAVYALALPGVQEWLVLALFTPCLTYIGARTVDGFTTKGK